MIITIPYSIFFAAIFTLVIILYKIYLLGGGKKITPRTTFKGNVPLILMGADYFLTGFYWTLSAFLLLNKWYIYLAGAIIGILFVLIFISDAWKKEEDKNVDTSNSSGIPDSYNGMITDTTLFPIIGKEGAIDSVVSKNIDGTSLWQYMGTLKDGSPITFISDDKMKDKDKFVITGTNGKHIFGEKI